MVQRQRKKGENITEGEEKGGEKREEAASQSTFPGHFLIPPGWLFALFAILPFCHLSLIAAPSCKVIPPIMTFIAAGVTIRRQRGEMSNRVWEWKEE